MAPGESGSPPTSGNMRRLRLPDALTIDFSFRRSVRPLLFLRKRQDLSCFQDTPLVLMPMFLDSGRILAVVACPDFVEVLL